MIRDAISIKSKILSLFFELKIIDSFSSEFRRTIANVASCSSRFRGSPRMTISHLWQVGGSSKRSSCSHWPLFHDVNYLALPEFNLLPTNISVGNLLLKANYWLILLVTVFWSVTGSDGIKHRLESVANRVSGVIDLIFGW